MCQEIAGNITTELREYNFRGIYNFRDLGGYKLGKKKIVAWQKLYRSGELQHMTGRDLFRLQRDVRPVSVIDLRSPEHIDVNGTGRLDETGAHYYNIPLIIRTREEKEAGEFNRFSGSGEEMLYRIGQEYVAGKLLEALEIIADPDNLPLIFFCNAGKMRTGLLAAMILAVLGVSDDDIVSDYMLSLPFIQKFFERGSKIPENAESYKDLPDYMWQVEPESMIFFLSGLKKEYGSARDYFLAQGADKSLFTRLEKALIGIPAGPSTVSE